MKNKQFNENMLDDLLNSSKLKAPEGTTKKIMDKLPDSVPTPLWGTIIHFWPADKWVMPAFAGAVTAVLLIGATLIYTDRIFSDQVRVTFEIQAPDASKIELVGSFNNWEPGNIELKGPNKAGRWSTSVKLKEGRHEYMFLVDGKTWITDPSAAIYRPDGFGRDNAIIDI